MSYPFTAHGTAEPPAGVADTVVDLQLDDSDSQASGRALRDSDGQSITVGQYLLLRAGFKPQTVIVFEDLDTCDLWLRLKSDGGSQGTSQRVDELAGDVTLMRM